MINIKLKLLQLIFIINSIFFLKIFNFMIIKSQKLRIILHI